MQSREKERRKGVRTQGPNPHAGCILHDQPYHSDSEPRGPRTLQWCHCRTARREEAPATAAAAAAPPAAQPSPSAAVGAAAAAAAAPAVLPPAPAAAAAAAPAGTPAGRAAAGTAAAGTAPQQAGAPPRALLRVALPARALLGCCRAGLSGQSTLHIVTETAACVPVPGRRLAAACGRLQACPCAVSATAGPAVCASAQGLSLQPCPLPSRVLPLLAYLLPPLLGRHAAAWWHMADPPQLQLAAAARTATPAVAAARCAAAWCLPTAAGLAALRRAACLASLCGAVWLVAPR